MIKETEDTLFVDLCILGGGIAGITLAEMAVRQGLDVALIEEDVLGGKNLHYGTIHSKALRKAAKIAQTARMSEQFGIIRQNPITDKVLLNNYITSIIERLEPMQSLERMEGLGVKVFQGRATFNSAEQVQIGEICIGAEHFVIATGSIVPWPNIRNLDSDKTLDYKKLFGSLEKVKSLMIYGSDIYALELAQFCNRLNIKTRLILDGPFLPHEDDDIRGILLEKLESEGMQIIQNARPTEVVYTIDTESEGNPERVTLFFNHEDAERSATSDKFLVAHQSQPNIRNLNLERIGVTTLYNSVEVNNYLQTSNDNIFIMGDVLGKKANRTTLEDQAHIIVDQIISGKRRIYEEDNLAIIDTDPCFARIGLTEKQAIEKYGYDGVKTIKWPYKESEIARVEKSEHGLIKVVLFPNDRIVSASILGENASEMIQIFELAMSRNMKFQDLSKFLRIPLTYNSTIKDMAEAYEQSKTPSLLAMSFKLLRKTKRFITKLFK